LKFVTIAKEKHVQYYNTIIWLTYSILSNVS